MLCQMCIDVCIDVCQIKLYLYTFFKPFGGFVFCSDAVLTLKIFCVQITQIISFYILFFYRVFLIFFQKKKLCKYCG